jgi:transcription factor IIIB subunit 2
VSIYFASRRLPENTLLLMDLAEKIHINVWALGDTYKAFLKKLYEKDPATLKSNNTVQEIEPLMLKYCRKLEFGSDSHRVANDACAILKRMKRDWMVQGRQPAGLCGACIILAARMNNFRRTVREVVYVVKVADTTINKRLHEFTRTESSTLTIQQFRKFGQKLKVKAQPPAVYMREAAEERKRKRAAGEEEEVSIDQRVHPEPSPAASGRNRSTRKKQKASNDEIPRDGSQSAAAPRLDDDGFAIPELPIDQTLMDADNEEHIEYLESALEEDNDSDLMPLPKKYTRKKRKEKPIVVPEEDLEIEEEIEAEIEYTIKDWESVFGKFEENANHPVLKAAERTARRLVDVHQPNADISNEEEITTEYDDDPDIRDCELSPLEVAIKERVWITENEDWLRAQQAKILAQALEEASGKVKKPKQRRKHHQMGDGSVLEGEPAASAAEAVQKMLNKRAKNFSSHINYDKLKEIFPGGNSSTEGSTPGASGQASPAATPSAPQQTRAPAVIEDHDEDEDAEGEYDDEHQTAYAEEEDLENEHQYDDDEGYGDTDYPDDY